MNNEDSIQGIMLSIMNLLELETFDYTVIQFMGKGAFSSVIRSVNTKTGKESAIKVIDKKFLEKVYLISLISILRRESNTTSI